MIFLLKKITTIRKRLFKNFFQFLFKCPEIPLGWEKKVEEGLKCRY